MSVKIRTTLFLVAIPAIVWIAIYATRRHFHDAPQELPPAIVKVVPKQNPIQAPDSVETPKTSITNGNEQKGSPLAEELASAKKDLVRLERTIFSTNATLKFVEEYPARLERWYQANSANVKALNKYLDADGSKESLRRNKAFTDLSNVLVPIIVKEQSEANTNITSFFQASLNTLLAQPQPWSILAIANPGFQIPTVEERTFENYLTTINNIGPQLEVLIHHQINDTALTQDIYEGIKTRTQLQLLQSMVDVYLQTNSPKELVGLRRHIRDLHVLLSRETGN